MYVVIVVTSDNWHIYVCITYKTCYTEKSGIWLYATIWYYALKLC